MAKAAIASIILASATAWLMHRRLRRKKKKLERQNNEVWSIGMYEGPEPSILGPAKGISNPILTAQDVTDIDARFVADPFMVRHDNDWHLFFEVLNKKRNRGEIGHAVSNDLKSWAYTGIVLRKREHLSYPYVFSHEKAMYMIPECAKSGSVTLYRATQFPEKWEPVSALLTGSRRNTPLLDPSVVFHEGHWYLFTYNRKGKSLHLFVSGTLAGQWTEHPKSPVVAGCQRFARPGGRIVRHEGILLRFSQDGTPHYGSKSWAFRITELTPETYREEPAADAPVIGAGSEAWNNAGMHTVDPHLTDDGRWIAMVDGLEFRHLSRNLPTGSRASA